MHHGCSSALLECLSEAFRPYIIGGVTDFAVSQNFDPLLHHVKFIYSPTQLSCQIPTTEWDMTACTVFVCARCCHQQGCIIGLTAPKSVAFSGCANQTA